MYKFKQHLVNLNQKNCGLNKYNNYNYFFKDKFEKIVDLKNILKKNYINELSILTFGNYLNFENFYLQLFKILEINKNQYFLYKRISSIIKSILLIYNDKKNIYQNELTNYLNIKKSLTNILIYLLINSFDYKKI